LCQKINIEQQDQRNQPKEELGQIEAVNVNKQLRPHQVRQNHRQQARSQDQHHQNSD
jgi:hypothetical protein